MSYRPEQDNAQSIPCSPEIQERSAILEAVTREKGHIKSVAEDLDMPVRTLYRKLKKYNIDPQKYRRWDG